MDAYLEGRVAIVTGGFSGIGKAIALALAERGATIAVGARRLPEDAIEELDKVAEGFFISDSTSLMSVASMRLWTVWSVLMAMPISW
jgi:NAD(P)-dependent dehydrogenase (short-subunit alcohol dehydrogenase family)